MFDLFRSRDKAVRMLLGGLLVLVALSMLTYLVPSYNAGGGPGDTVVAEIGKEALTMPEVAKVLQQQMRNRQMPPEMIPHIVPQIIEGMITERALAYEAQRLGFQVNDADVANTIRNMIPSLFPEGKFVGRDAYAGMLAQQNTTIPDFERDIQRQVLVNRLRDLVLQGTVVTPAEVELEFRRRNEKVKVEYVKLTADKFRSLASATPAEAEQYYKTHTSLYQVPEKRGLAVLVLDQAKVEQSLTPSDADLERLYNLGKDRFRVPERVKVRHILLKTTGDAAKDAAIKTKAEDLLKQIKGGAKFADLAKKNSEDPGSATKGGELPDWVQRGQTVPEFEQSAFNMKPGQLSELVKTQYGYHIIQLIDKQEAHMQPLSEVREQIAGEWRKGRVNDQIQQTIDKAQAALQKDPLHPEKAAADFNLQLVKAERFGGGDTLPDIGASADFQQAVASLKPGEVAQPVAVSATKVALAVCTGVFPAHVTQLAEVEAQVREAVLKEKLEKVVAEKTAELAQKAASMQGDLQKAAKSMGLEVKTSEEFDRPGAIEGLGPATYLADAFTKPVGSLVGPVSAPDARVLAKVLSHVDADMSKLAAQHDAIRDELKARKSRERSGLFEAGLRQALIRDGKIKIHQDVVSRLAANYRG